jgi:hypothetical protein
MPEAAVYEQNYSSGRKGQVRFAGQPIVVQAIPIAEFMEG